MDNTCTLRGLPAFTVSPGLHFHFTCGDEGLEVQQGVGFLYQAVHAALFKSQFFEEHLLVLVGLQWGDILLGFGGNDHGLGTFCLSYFLNLTWVFVTILGWCLVNIADVEHRFGREQEEIVSHLLFVLRLKGYWTGVLALFQHLLISLQYSGFHLLVLVASGSGFLCFGQLSLDGLQVLELQFGVDDFLVLNRIHGSTAFAYNIIIVEAAQNVNDCICFADVSEEFIAETFTLWSTFHKACDIHNFTRGGNDASGMY